MHVYIQGSCYFLYSNFKEQQTPVFDESAVSKETFSPESIAQFLLSAA